MATKTTAVKEKKITPKQEKFCQNIVDGMSQREAYLSAYQNNCGYQAASNEGSRIMKMPHIQKRIKELQEPIETAIQVQAISETQKIKDLLWERIEICRTQGDETAIARYTDQLNKLNGAYKEIKNAEEDEPPVGDLDNETLLKIVGG